MCSLPPTMITMQVACSVFSNSFRVVSYVFLRIIPFSAGTLVIPILYSLYLACLYTTLPPPVSHAAAKHEKADDTRSNPADISSGKNFFKQALSICFSLPTSIRRLQTASLLINSLIFLAAVDFVVGPYFDDALNVTFTRVGAVYPDAVKIAIRYPSTTEPIHILWRPSRNNSDHSWTVGPSVTLSHVNDWVNTTRLPQLWPDTAYEYMLATQNGTILPYPPRPVHFRTFPDPRLHRGSNFRFLASSCMKPNFPYAPLRGNRIEGFDLLAHHLWPEAHNGSIQIHAESADGATFKPDTSNQSVPSNDSETSPIISSTPTEFMIFLGDFIYADVPLYFGDTKDAYRRLYRRNYQSPSFRKVYERLPIIHTYDDHEFVDDFVGKSVDPAPYPNGADSFRIYNSQANYDSEDEDQHYYEFAYGADAAFFVMDTRRHRSDVDKVEPSSRTMLGERQLSVFYNWLSKVNSTMTFKFVVTSVPFTSLWTYGSVDSWAGYEEEKAAILDALFTVPNVIVISGDRHEFAAIEFTGKNPSSHRVLEFSTSPMSMFYIPLVRSLKLQSDDTVSRIRRKVAINDEGLEVAEDFVEEIPKESVLKSFPIGNYKWSAFNVDTRDQDHPVLRVDVVIDGLVHHNFTIEGISVKHSASTALGTIIPESFKGVLDRIGLTPNKWF